MHRYRDLRVLPDFTKAVYPGLSSANANLQAQPDTAPKQDKTKPRAINIGFDKKMAIVPKKTIVFRTLTSELGKADGYVTGRMAIKGKASLIGEKLPRRRKTTALQLRVRTLFQNAFGSLSPHGNGSKLELSLGGETLALELVPGFEQSPAFQVSGRFSAKNRTLKVTGSEIVRATITLDATAWISPTRPANASTPTQPSVAQVPGDASVEHFSFAGHQARFSGKKRSGGVALKSIMEKFEKEIPSFVKNHKFLSLPEQRAAFFQQMRTYFGTDERTIAHFAKMQDAGLKGAKTYLHEEAVKRLKAVESEIGRENMPSSGGVGWPRSEASFSGRQTLRNLHNIGFAVDFNAYQAPHIKSRKILDLLQIVTSRSPSLNKPPRGIDTKSVGTTFTSGTPEEKQTLAADTKVKRWLADVEAEARAVAKASEDFRTSLKTTDTSGTTVDLAPKLQELRQKWFAAKTEEERAAVIADLPEVLKPWIDKVKAQITSMESKIRTAGYEPAQLPASKALTAATVATRRLSLKMNRLNRRLGDKLNRRQRIRLAKLILSARTMLGKTGSEPTSDAEVVAEFRRLLALIEQRKSVLGQKKWLDRVNALNASLTGDPSFVFGKRRKAVVSDPSLAQLVDTGFFTLQGAPKAGKQAFNVDFVKSMVKHGFTHGGTWSTPDYMHFELRWKGPAQ